MRTVPLIPAVVAVLGLTTFALAGCSAPTASSCERPETDAAFAEIVPVSGEVGDLPEFDPYTPFHTEKTLVSDAVPGEGTAVTTDAQLVVFDITIVSGTDGETVLQTAYDQGQAPIQVANLVQSIPALSDALHCAAEGSRTVIGLAPDDMVPEFASQIALGAEDSAIAVVDLRKVYLASADGEAVFNSRSGMPSVVRAPGGRPGVTIPESAAPDEVVVQTLLRGDGPEVTGDVPVRVHYTGIVWDTREEFDSSWDGEPASLTLDGVIPGFAQALEGQAVGSQVLVVIPPEEGYGDQEQQGIPANSTLVFVIDILGLDAAPTP
ncbi:FKBP-type peptidyl-prolyl cis-trans isomerase [Planococcus sp. APC 4015]|nr:FKBP-type peptidyl-prolyl cis-trans isomerase [Planococcus sp. APC 4015]